MIQRSEASNDSIAEEKGFPSGAEQPSEASKESVTETVDFDEMFVRQHGGASAHSDDRQGHAGPHVGRLEPYDLPGEDEVKSEPQLLTKEGVKLAVQGPIDLNGRMTISFPNKASYTGRLQDGTAHGEGQFEAADGSVYTGEWANGVAEGNGVLQLPDGTRYEGEFANDVFHGEGKLEDVKGYFFEGAWERGLPNGFGKLVTPKGDKMEGIFVNGELTGQGKYESAESKRYEGEFVEFDFCGHGRCEWPNGMVYVGYFVSNVPEGEGELRLADGATITSKLWRDGVPGKDVVAKTADGRDATVVSQKGQGKGDGHRGNRMERVNTRQAYEFGHVTALSKWMRAQDLDSNADDESVVMMSRGSSGISDIEF